MEVRISELFLGKPGGGEGKGRRKEKEGLTSDGVEFVVGVDIVD